MGGNDRAGMRKERVPNSLIANFKHVVDGHANAQPMVAQVAGRGVNAAALHMQGLVKDDSSEDLLDCAAAQAFLDALHEKYSHVERRIGRERIQLLPFGATTQITNA